MRGNDLAALRRRQRRMEQMARRALAAHTIVTGLMLAVTLGLIAWRSVPALLAGSPQGAVRALSVPEGAERGPTPFYGLLQPFSGASDAGCDHG